VAEAPAEASSVTFEEIPVEIEAAPVEEAPAVEPPAPAPEPAAEETTSFDFSMDTVTEEPAPAPPAEPEPVAAPPAPVAVEPPPPPPPPPVEEPVAAAAEDPGTIEYDFGTPAAEEAAPAQEEAAVEEEAAPAPSMSSSQFLSELSDELGDFGLTPAAEEKAAPAAKAPAAKKEEKPKGKGKPEKKDQLREVFDEFRADMGEATEQEEESEDLETHYNLGIAYREMGLMEEAIGEFQKVAKSVQSGRPFKYSMQCYTLLGLTFMDKGQPKISAIWYEKALKTPDLDPESVMAVRYDLGLAQDLAGDFKAALESFNHVYAMNIDYRDVGERIAELHKKV
jgi:tetratricopeptide (TPR) repeat protein